MINKNKILSFFAFTLFLYSNDIHSKEIFISPNGNDNNVGSIESPLQTLGSAANMAKPGDQLLFLQGTYNITNTQKIKISGTETQPITFMPYKDANVTFDASSLITKQTSQHNYAITTMGSNLEIIGFNIINSTGGAIGVHKGNHVTIADNNITNNGEEQSEDNSAILVSGTRDVTIRGNNLYDNIGTHLYLDNAENVLVEGNRIYNTELNARSSDGIRIATNNGNIFFDRTLPPSNLVFKNNTIYNTGKTISLHNGQTNIAASNALFEQNSLWNAQQTLLDLSNPSTGMHHILFAQNIFKSGEGQYVNSGASLNGIVFNQNCWDSSASLPSKATGNGNQSGNIELVDNAAPLIISGRNIISDNNVCATLNAGAQGFTSSNFAQSNIPTANRTAQKSTNSMSMQDEQTITIMNDDPMGTMEEPIAQTNAVTNTAMTEPTIASNQSTTDRFRDFIANLIQSIIQSIMSSIFGIDIGATTPSDTSPPPAMVQGNIQESTGSSAMPSPSNAAKPTSSSSNSTKTSNNSNLSNKDVLTSNNTPTAAQTISSNTAPATPSTSTSTPPITGNRITSVNYCTQLLSKFGFGVTPTLYKKYCTQSDLSELKQAIKDQATTPSGLPVVLRGMPSTSSYIQEFGRLAKLPRNENMRRPNQVYAGEVALKETSRRIQANATAENQFAERMLHFWSNHFNISRRKNAPVRMLIGAMEREAIRANMYGNFPAILIAVSKHPAMLNYLDNNRSVGMNSTIGMRNKKRGINENLAREILELHTLGVDGGYTQQDVESLAKVISGWTWSTEAKGFTLNKAGHEPGPKTVLGRTFFTADNDDEAYLLSEGEAVLRYIASQPATARFIATKMLRHFIQDTPSDAMVNTLAKAYQQSGGNLTAMYEALIELPESFNGTFRKYPMPYDIFIGTMRLYEQGVPGNLNDVSDARKLMNRMRSMSEYVLWEWATPDGWPDIKDYWRTPQQMLRTIEWCPGFIRNNLDGDLDPEQVIENNFGLDGVKQYRLIVANSPEKAMNQKQATLCAMQLFRNR